jgi:cathepsin D
MVKGNVFIAGVNNGRPLASRQGMIIDTGTTLLVGPTSAVRRIFSLVPGVSASSVGAGYYDAPCNNIPIISLGFGRLYPIPASSMNLGETYSGSGRCVLALVGGAFNDWIVGDTFLSNVYSTFDYTKNAVGFAPLA